MTSIKRLLAFARDEARSPWGVEPRSALLLWSVPFLFFLGAVALRLVAAPVWRQLRADEGALEWTQFAFLVGAVAFSVLAAWALLRSGRRGAGALYLLLAAGLAFVAGEEIAWGQHILGFETPEGLAELNYKAETSLHNVTSLIGVFHLAKLMIGVYGVFGVWVLRSLSRRREVRGLDLFVVPVFLSSPFLFVLLQRIGQLTVFTERLPAGYGEFEELVFTYGMLAFTALVWRRVRPGAPEAVPRPLEERARDPAPARSVTVRLGPERIGERPGAGKTPDTATGGTPIVAPPPKSQPQSGEDHQS